MPPELTPDEASFFDTGELPESLVPTPEPVVEPVVKEPPAEQVPPVPAAAPAFDMSLLDRLLDEKLARLQSQFVAPAPKVEVPDRESDPLGNMMHNLESINSRLTQTEQATNARQQMEQFTSACQAAKSDFETRQPDFKDAYAHVRALRAEDLRAAGASEKEIPNILLQDELQLAQTALQRGKNPAEELYTMAKRYGYAPKVAAPAQNAPKVDAAAKLDSLRENQAAATHPGKATTETDLTLQGLKDASTADLNKLVQDDRMWAQIVGGASPHDLFP